MKEIRYIIVDDEPDVRKRLENLLLKLDGIVVVASIGDAEKAIEEISFKNPDIVFIDVEMPGMNSFDVIHAVRKNNCSPTFVFVTAYNQYSIQAIRNSAFDFILKPVSITDLSDMLNRYKLSRVDSSISIHKQPRFICLSKREKDVLECLFEGTSSREIAEQLFISIHTVNTHRRSILRKLGVKNSMELLCLK